MNLLRRTLPTFRFLALCMTMASIAVVASERVFWFWTPTLAPHLELMAFYAIPIAAVVVVIGRFGAEWGWSLLLVAPIFAFMVEGVLTPVVYTGAFLPVFPAWFSWWHGMAALLGFVFVLRAWLLAERTRLLAGGAVGIGTFWGLWSATLWLPENVGDEELAADSGELIILDPAAFARYTATFTIVLIVSHLLLGFVWPARAQTWRAAERTVGVLAGVALIGWTVVVPWAIPMFVLYLVVPWRALRWHREAGEAPAARNRAEVDVFAQLSGRVRPLATAPLLLIAPIASAVYAVLWALDPSEVLLRWLMYTTIAWQSVAAGVLVVLAIRRTRRRRPAPAAGVTAAEVTVAGATATR